jgi:hypothetical protein
MAAATTISTFAFDKPQNPAKIHIQNLRALLLRYEADEKRDGPNSPAVLFRECTRQFLEFYETTQVSQRFIELYSVLRDGIHGKITNIEFPNSRVPGVTPHGVPYVVNFVFCDPSINTKWCTVNNSEMGTWVITLPNRTMHFSDKYKLLARTPISPLTSMSEFHHRCYKIVAEFDKIYTAYASDCAAACANACANAYTTSVRDHFACIVARGMVPWRAAIDIDELIDTFLPNESSADIEIRKSLRESAHTNSEQRYLLALLHVTHSNPEVISRGKLLMQSASSDGSVRATEWMRANHE